MLSIRKSAGVLLLVTLVAPAWGKEPDLKPGLFDGSKQTVIVNGYSTSFHWPQILQRKFDRYFDGKRILEVKSATQGGTPIAKWMDVNTSAPLTPWTAKLRPLLKEKTQPAVVLAQQSLQWVYGDRASGIRDQHDAQRIRQGALALQRYTSLLLKEGADAVVVATHIYKKGMEPQVGNERLALAAFLQSQPPHVFAGPDVWEPTSKVWPLAFQADQVHPNEVGAEIMAHYWFARLLELDGLPVPDWSEQEMKAAIANPPKTATSKGNSPRGRLAERLLRHDRNQDGKITRDEFKGPAPLFNRLDQNSDGVLSQKEISSMNSQKPSQKRR